MKFATNKEKAIYLRKKGFSYSEILKQIPIAKSTLGSWLHSVGLSKEQKQRLTEKKLASALRGARKRKEQRLAITKEIKEVAISQIGNISETEFWLMGTMLYWAEGSKEKDYRPGSRTEFTNSDPLMLKIFLKWVLEILKIPLERLKFEIYIHESYKNKVSETKKYWSKILDININKFQSVYFKKNKLKTNRKNIGQNYFGLVKIRITASSDINRKIAGWIEGVCKNCGVV